MNKKDIIIQLNTEHLSFWETASHLSNTPILLDGKWSVDQNTEHLNKVLSQVSNFLNIPKDTIELNFGLSNRKSITYKSLIQAYQMALSNGVKSTAPFIPDSNLDTLDLITEGKILIENLILNIQNWEEDDLDLYNCPHPALGQITVRELLYFTINHVQHHHEIIKK